MRKTLRDLSAEYRAGRLITEALENAKEVYTTMIAKPQEVYNNKATKSSNNIS